MNESMADTIRTELEDFARRRMMAGATMTTIIETNWPEINDPSKPSNNHGTPPFMVLADMVPMGVIDAGGEFSALPYGYDPDTDVIDENAFEKKFGELPDALWEGFGAASREVSKLLDQRLAGSLLRKVAGLHGKFSQLAEQSEFELPEGELQKQEGDGDEDEGD